LIKKGQNREKNFSTGSSVQLLTETVKGGVVGEIAGSGASSTFFFLWRYSSSTMTLLKHKRINHLSLST
jgi:hypothetical protein